jgi:two-component system phosphate regulon response regulator PhoB
MARALLALPDPTVRVALRTALEAAGHVVAERASGPDAAGAALRDMPDVLLTEIDLPGHPAFALLREIGAARLTRIIVMSARAEEVDRIVAFELGADDYVRQPFSIREIVLRVAAVLRAPDGRALEHVGELVLDRAAPRLSRCGASIPLTRGELRIFLDLVDARGAVRTRTQLLREALGEDRPAVNGRSIDTHVKRLRGKLGRAADLVETVQGVGYRLAIRVI